MPPEELNYLAGLFEGEGTISVEVEQETRYRHGIRLKPYVEFTISLDDAIIVELFKKHIPVNWLVKVKKEDNAIKIRLRDQESIRKFIEILSQYFRLPTTRRKTELMIKILSKMGKHKRGGFIRDEMLELLILATELRSLQKKQKRNNSRINTDALITNIREPPEPADEEIGVKPTLNAGSSRL